MPSKRKVLKTPVPPFVYFSVFLVACLALPYWPHGIPGRRFFYWVGIVLPLFLAMRDIPKVGVKLLVLKDWVRLPRSAWLLVLLVAVATRFYGLTDLNPWPTRDDGYFLFQAMDTGGRESLPFFYGIGEMPPVFRTVLGVFLGLAKPSLTSLWLFPALISLVTVGVGTWAVRSFTSKSFAFLFAMLLAGSLWPVLLGRFCNVWVLLFLWECLTLGILAVFSIQKVPARARVWALGAGACVGAGFYISPTHWAFFSLAATLGLVGLVFRKDHRRWKEFFFYLFSAGVVSFLFWIEALGHRYGRHVEEVWTGVGSLLTFDHLVQCGRYVWGLFWGFGGPNYDYGPVLGGFLNPLLGAFFFLGLVFFLRARKFSELGWMGLVSLVLLTPGFLTRDLEMQRVLSLIPLLLFVAVVGLVHFVSSLPKRWVILSLVCFLGSSVGFDFYRLAVPLHETLELCRDRQILESQESANAYEVLKRKAKQEGPGYLFLDYVAVPLDQTLLLATYPFNAAQNPELKDPQPTWAAFLTNVNYRPFLEKRFPDAQCLVVGSHLLPWDGELMLVVLPLSPANRATVDLWLKAQPLFHEATAGILRRAEERSREEVLAEFLKGYSLVQGDSFLVSVFWEICYFNHSADRKFVDSLNDLTQVLGKGYPAAHVYNELGSLLYFKKDPANAQRAFLKAVQLGGNHTLAPENLKVLSGRSN